MRSGCTSFRERQILGEVLVVRCGCPRKYSFNFIKFIQEWRWLHIILSYFSEGMPRSDSEPLVEFMVVGVGCVLQDIAGNGERVV